MRREYTVAPIAVLTGACTLRPFTPSVSVAYWAQDVPAAQQRTVPSIVDAVAISVSVLAPGMAMLLNVSGVAAAAGGSTPFAFLLGVDPASVDLTRARPNASLGMPEVERKPRRLAIGAHQRMG